MDIQTALNIISSLAIERQKEIEAFNVASATLQSTFQPQFKDLENAKVELASTKTLLIGKTAELNATENKLLEKLQELDTKVAEILTKDNLLTEKDVFIADLQAQIIALTPILPTIEPISELHSVPE